MPRHPSENEDRQILFLSDAPKSGIVRYPTLNDGE
jgi:hypothetical protein